MIIETDYPKNDNQYEDDIISEVSGSAKDGYTITHKKGWSFFVPNTTSIIPKIGMNVRFYSKGVGSIVRGLFIDGQRIFYMTEKQQKRVYKKKVRGAKVERQKKLDKERPELDKRYNDLPDVFKRRIDKFRSTNPNFRRDYESYEMFCCEQAVIFANHFKIVDALKEWGKKKYEEQKAELPELSGNHSINTFGCAFSLASAYLTSPELVVKMHGALTPLVGCKEYGCSHEK